MHLERTAARFRLKVRARGILYDFVHLKNVRPGEGLFWHSSGLRVSLNEFIRAHPVKEILPAVPYGEHYVRVALVYRAQNLIGDEAGHLIHQTRALTEPLLKS